MQGAPGHLWQARLALILAVLLLAPAGGAADGGAPPEPYVTDYGLFSQELRAVGALKFFDNTEDLLRVAEFERALLRYRFLKGRIAADPGYRPLVAMINHRLTFLKGEMRLGEADLAPLTPRRVRSSPPRPSAPGSPPSPPAAAGTSAAAPLQAAAPPPAAESSESPRDVQPAANLSIPQPGPPDSQSAAAPVSTALVQEQPPILDDRPPPPLPSRWQRLKRRLLFWRR